MTARDEISQKRRELLKLSAIGGIGALSGCLGFGGGSDVETDTEFQDELNSLNVAENWKDRRLASFDNWSYEARQSTPSTENQGKVDAWLNSEGTKQGPWKPPSNWEDTIASEIDQLEIINFGGLQHDPATAATHAAFERETGIKVNTSPIPAGQAHTKQNTFLSSETGEPAIFQVGTPVTLSTFIQAGYLEPIDGLMPEEEMWGPYPSYIKNAFTTDIGPDEGSHLYASPGIRWNTVMHIRTDLLEEQGIDPQRFSGEYTWEDLETVMKAFQGTDSYGFAYWGGQWNFIIKNFKELVYQQGANLVQDDGTVVMNSDAGVTALSKMVEWREQGYVPESVTNFGLGDLNDQFINGNIAMISSMSSQIGRGINNGLTPGEDYMVALQPKATTGPSPRQCGLGHLNNTSLNRFADPAPKLAGALYMDCRWSYESQWWEYVYEANSSYMNPVYEDAAEQDAVPFSEVRMEAANKVDNDYFPSAKSIMQTLGQELKSAVAGSKTPQKALDTVQNEVDTVLGQ